MNALNLRVSSVKTTENVKKNAEMRASRVKLPTQWEQSDEWYCMEVRTAKTVPDQVACVKNIFHKLDGDKRALQFLTDLLFSSPLKNPVRNQIIKLLITASKSPNESLDVTPIITSLENSLRSLLVDTQTYKSSLKWNVTIASFSGCFENFEAGLKALKQCIGQVFPFVCASVDKYTNELNSSTSPSLRNDYYLYIHNSIRFLLNCVQEFGVCLKASHLDHLTKLYTRCKQIILDGDIPMDPRTNAGNLMAYIAKLNGVYADFVGYVKDIQNPHEIAMCVGVINTCDEQDFQLYSIDIRDICYKIDKISNANATVPNILLCATRALYQVSKLCLHYASKLPETLENVKEILEKLMVYAVAHMEHHMDSVRHICRDIMRNVVAVASKVKCDLLLQRIYEACNSDHLSLSVKCVILQQAGYVLGADEVVLNCGTLFTHLFAQYLGRDFIVNNLYEALMTSNYKEQPFEKWSSVWISYLLRIASVQDSRLTDIEALIVKGVKCDARVVQNIILMADSDETKIPISTKLSTLWAVRKSGIKIDNYAEIMQKFSKHIQLSILSNSDETRIMALRLLVETHKSTEPLSALECEHFITYLQYNANCQSPATRQKSLSMLTKALLRCQVGLMKQLKGKTTSEAIEEPPLELRFLQDFMKSLIANLFDGANFSRRSVSLQLLQQCFTIIADSGLKLLPLLPKSALNALLICLADTYESNKELAVKMLQILEANYGEGSLIESFQLKINVEELQSMFTSVKPSDSVTASYQLEFLCHRGHAAIFGDFAVPDYKPCIYAALQWLLMELKDGFKLATFSILEAAKLNPLYGLLFAVKHLMNSLDFRLLAENLLWRNLMADLIVACKNLTDVVAPIVNSSSPEGHLPNDFSELPEELLKEKQNTLQVTATATAPCKILSPKLRKIDMASVKTTPQMVLICAWRTVKEVSLILGDIVLYSPIQMSASSEHYLITKQQILEIGEHFKLLLSETKHRGAFEQAYVGFSKLCCRLWTVEAQDLNTLPMAWLKDLMTLISQEDISNGKICATRRSAGVPFMVQALITSELKVGSTKALIYCMTHLIELCSSRQTSSESRTHALNILRALFRCTDLNEAVGEYVSEGVATAIRGYDATNWSEKNSATLLFAALITRIFGVQRTKDSDNLNIRNKMTGRVFFLRYPKLYDFFLDELKKASVLIENQQKANKLHPLLLILSRLYPSALEGTESNLKLSEFIPYVSKCGGCPEMQTRHMAGKAVVGLTNKDQVKALVLQKCAEIVLTTDCESVIKLNLLHGYLLQIFYLTKYHKTFLNEDLIADITSAIVGVHQRTQLKNAVILKVMLDIFTEILNSLSTLSLKPIVVQQLSYFATLPILNDPSLASYYAVLHKSTFLYNLHIMRLTLPEEALGDYLLEPPVIYMPVEQAETCLNVMLYLLAVAKQSNTNNFTTVAVEDESNFADLVEEFEIMPSEIQFVNSLTAETLHSLSMDLRQSKALYVTLKQLLEMPKFYPEAAMKSYAVLSFLTNFDFSLTDLLKKSKIQSDDVKSPLTMCVERILHAQGVDYERAEMCLEYLTEIAHPSQPYCLRLKAANSIAHIAVHYPKSLEMKRMTFVRLFLKLMLDLLMDDDYDIREFAAKLVLRNLEKDIVLPLSNTLTLMIPHQTDTLISTVVQRLFLQYTVDLLTEFATDDDFVLDVFKAITVQYAAAATSEDENQQNSLCDSAIDVEIFDKNESNAFAEPMTIVMDAVIVFKFAFGQRCKVVEYVKCFEDNLKKRGLVH